MSHIQTSIFSTVEPLLMKPGDTCYLVELDTVFEKTCSRAFDIPREDGSVGRGYALEPGGTCWNRSFDGGDYYLDKSEAQAAASQCVVEKITGEWIKQHIAWFECFEQRLNDYTSVKYVAQLDDGRYLTKHQYHYVFLRNRLIDSGGRNTTVKKLIRYWTYYEYEIYNDDCVATEKVTFDYLADGTVKRLDELPTIPDLYLCKDGSFSEVGYAAMNQEENHGLR